MAYDHKCIGSDARTELTGPRKYWIWIKFTPNKLSPGPWLKNQWTMYGIPNSDLNAAAGAAVVITIIPIIK